MMKWLKEIFAYSEGGVVAGQPVETAGDKPEHGYRIVPVPHGKWVLQHWEIYSHPYASGVSGYIYCSEWVWKTIAEYESIEAAHADYEHLCTAPIELKPVTGDA